MRADELARQRAPPDGAGSTWRADGLAGWRADGPAGLQADELAGLRAES
ncbi:hypothetical protein ACWCY6_04430 [Streptomyces sp. 900105755]